MPFLRAGFNARNRRTGIFGWTRHVAGKRFEPAELIVFTAANDFAWYSVAERFLAWGEQVVLGSWRTFELAKEHQEGLPQSALPSSDRRPRPVKIVLPYPVSANRYWISFYASKAKRVFTGPTSEAKAYKEECGWLAKAAGVHQPLECPVELRFRLVPKNGICMDLDNALKVSIDALKGIVYADDKQVYRIVADKADADPSGGARLEVEILPYQIPMALEEAA